MSTAYFLLNIETDHEIEVIRRIKEILESDNIIDYEIQETYGIYEVVLKITAKNDDNLRHILLEKIRPIDNIQSAITMMVIAQLKLKNEVMARTAKETIITKKINFLSKLIEIKEGISILCLKML